jgi:hypothetical protein
MKKPLKRIFIFVVFLFSLPFLGCNGGQPAPFIPPISDADMNAFLDFFFGELDNAANNSFILADCNAANTAFGSKLNMPEAIPCVQGGQQILTLTNLECNDPPLTILLESSVKFENCQIEGGLTLNGEETLTELREGDVFEAQDMAMGLQVNEFSFDIDNIFTAIQGSPGTCSGTIVVDGVSCEISADCTTCVF